LLPALNEKPPIASSLCILEYPDNLRVTGLFQDLFLRVRHHTTKKLVCVRIHHPTARLTCRLKNNLCAHASTLQPSYHVPHNQASRASRTLAPDERMNYNRDVCTEHLGTLFHALHNLERSPRLIRADRPRLLRASFVSRRRQWQTSTILWKRKSKTW
jgi:hypothetical protein